MTSNIVILCSLLQLYLQYIDGNSALEDVDALRTQIEGLRTVYDADIKWLKQDLSKEREHRHLLETELNTLKNRFVNLELSINKTGLETLASASDVGLGQTAAKGEPTHGLRIVRNALQKEKMVIRTLQEDVRNLQSESKIDKYGGHFEEMKQELKNISYSLKTHDVSLSVISYSVKEMFCDVYSKKISHTRSGQMYVTPGFVSDWILMRAQDETLSSVEIPHGLGHLPLKVEVQVRPQDGANAGWIFHGSGGNQIDDDSNIKHGGVVYVYNTSHVALAVPIKSNNEAGGHVIYTGEDTSWEGPHHQKSMEAYVRVKAWGEFDLPIPDFASEWTDVDIFNITTSFQEVRHNFQSYPDQVVLQVDLEDNGMVSEGIGSAMFCDSPGICFEYSNWGGVAYGFNKEIVRIWTPYVLDSQTYKGVGVGPANDGWGFRKSYSSKSGKVRVLAWKSLENQNVHREEISVKSEDETPLSSGRIDFDKDIVNVYTEAKDGPNQGYRFVGWGGAQNSAARVPFGGVLYSYSISGDVRIWRPNPQQKGHLVHIRNIYGNGINAQASDNATIILSVMRSRC